MPENQIVLDLETKNAFQDIGSRNAAELGVSLVGVYFYRTKEYRAYEESEIPQLEQDLAGVSRIIGFNTHKFDFVCLQPYFKYVKLAQFPSLDLMAEIEAILGHRLSLNSLAMSTLGEGKSGSGLDAIEYFRTGQMDKLKKYCLDDVRITKDVYEYGKLNKKLHFMSRDGKNKMQVNVAWTDPEPPANLSLF